METPFPLAIEKEIIDSEDKPKEEFNIKMNKENNIIEITIKNYLSFILINCLNGNDVLKSEYEKKYKINEFIKIKYLSKFNSIDDIFEQLKCELKKNNIKIKKEKDLINIYIPIDFKEEKEMVFKLPIKIKTEKEQIDILAKEISNLKNEINLLRDKNKILENENKNLKELFEEYIPYLKELKEKTEINLYKSIIIKNDEKKIDAIANWIKQRIDKDNLRFKMIFRMTEDGYNSDDFHKCCDGKGPTLVLIKTKNNYIFGGFTPLQWDKTSGLNYDLSDQTFIFSLNTMKTFNMIDSVNRRAIHCSNEGPIFGNMDFGLLKDMKIGESYANNSCNFLSNQNLELTMEKGQKTKFEIEECEIYEVFIS